MGAATHPELGKADSGSDEAADAEDDEDESSSAVDVRWRARLMAGFEHERERPAGEQTDPPESEYGFLLRQVRLGLRAELAQLFRIKVSFELKDALNPETDTTYTSPEYLRTAALEYRPSRAFRLTVGRYKRPFSRLELESTSDLPIRGRGLFNDLAIEDNQWGDRATGAMVSGRLKAPKLRWYLSLTNPAWSAADIDTEGLDVIGRLQLGVGKWLSVGVNGGYKYLKLRSGSLNTWGIGADARLDVGEGHLLLEANSVDLPLENDRPRGFVVLALFDYPLPLTAVWSLSPVLSAELADADDVLSQTESLRLIVGLNVLGYSGFRVMPQVALVRSLGDTSRLNPWPEGETYTLVLSLHIE